MANQIYTINMGDDKITTEQYCSAYPYPSVVEVLRAELYQLECDPTYKSYTTEMLAKKTNLIRTIREYASETYKPQFDILTYNYVLTAMPITIVHSGPFLVNKKLYTFKIESKKIFINKETNNYTQILIYALGDCFFECVDLLLSAIQLNIQELKQIKKDL